MSLTVRERSDRFGPIDPKHALDALHSIDPNCDRETWHAIGRATIAAGLTVEQIDAWSAPADNYSGERDVKAAFRGIKTNGGTGVGTLWKAAMEAGWEPPPPPETSKRHPSRPRAAGAPHKPAAGRPGASAPEVWARCTPATAEHRYIVTKSGTPEGLRVVPEGDPLRIAGASVAGWLAVPVVPLGGSPDEPVSLQFIPPPGAGKKLNLPGASMAGAFTVGNVMPGASVYLCEGIGQAWACWKATGAAAVVCFGWGRVRGVAAELRERDASARLVVVPDVGKEQEAERIARDVRGLFVMLPEGWEQNADVNDYAQREGFDALEALLSAPLEPKSEHGLEWEFADRLADVDDAPDELVQGVLTRGAMSVIYGDSNSGKTFAAIDVAAAVARGVSWMGRNTEPGMVIYLAAESPQSVRTRLRAYQKRHGVKVPNFVIVRSPLDLFDGNGDTDAVIALARDMERRTGTKCELIVGDTMARLAAGANENSGEDMGVVVRHTDRIRAETGAHFSFIHHSGKDAARGARGWSGLRAATDTEIEVTADDATKSHCLEITKQRDLPTKGERIGFALESVPMGQGKWGTTRTSCVLVATDAPTKTARGKRPSEVAGAITELLNGKAPAGMKRGAIVAHFAERYAHTSVYRELRKMLELGRLHEVAGIYTLRAAFTSEGGL